jgi:basic membrane protein A and related proteins
MKKLYRPFQFLVVALLVLSIAGGFVQQTHAQGDDTKITNVALVTPSARTNLGWDQQGADGIDTVADRLGITAEVQENGGYDDITPVLKDLKDGGAQLIICHASGYQTVCPEFAAEEGVPVAVIENPNAVVPGLVSDYETEAQEAAYLAGVLAAEMNKTGTVGIVVSDETPTWNYMTTGFAEGLNATNPDIKLIYSVIGQAAYDDAVGAKRVTEQQLAAGADIIFGMGDGASFGMIEAIREHNEDSANADSPAWFIDVIGDKREDYSDVLLTSVLFDYSGIYSQMITDLEAGDFGKVYTMNLENGGVRLLDLPEIVPTDIQTTVKTAEAGILDGNITVSSLGEIDAVKARLKELGY